MTRPPTALPTWQTVPWHPTLVVVAIVLSFWMDTLVSPYAAIRSVGLALAGAILLTAVGTLLFRSRHVGGVAVASLIALLYSKHLVRLISYMGERMDLLVFVVWLAASAAAVLLVIRITIRSVRRMDWPAATWLLNRMAILLLAASVGAGIVNGSFLAAVDDLSQGTSLSTGQAAAAVDPSQQDIYVVLLDGYPRTDVLRYAFDLDNTPFIDQLRARGFEVASQSHSDYLWTHVSLTSLFHMAYAEQIGPMKAISEGRAPLHPTLYDTVNHNPVFDEVRSRGYQVVGISGGFEQLSVRQADVFIDGGELNEFEIKLLNSTFLGNAISFALPSFASSQHGERIRTNLELLGEVARQPHDAPWLVFDHVPSPHLPTVFSQDGKAISVPIDDAFYADSPIERGISAERFAREYTAHLLYLNGLILDAVDEVLESSATPPIIVLMADHGSASAVDWLVTQPEEADPARLLERTAILFAAFTPERQDVFADDVSPVNIFRQLFDAYLNTQYGPAIPPPDGGHVPPVNRSVLNDR